MSIIKLTPEDWQLGTANRKRIAPKGGKEKALLGLIDETVALFVRLQKDVERVAPGGEFAGARRTLLLALYRGEPKTVPQIARARGASRQYTQMVVNPLVRDGYLELLDNPAHKRSRLVRLTGQGRTAVEDFGRREMEFLKRQAISVDAKKLYAAADALRQVREMMEGETWRQALDGKYLR
jgi:DNA-binding MarR family transcriptional regulator